MTAAAKGQADKFPSHGESSGTKITITPENKKDRKIERTRAW